MDKIGFFQIIYTTYKTSTNKDRIKKQFIFLEEVAFNNSNEMFKLVHETLKRYKTYNNICMLDFDKINNNYIFNKSRSVSLKLEPIKGIVQDGIKIDYIRGW